MLELSVTSMDWWVTGSQSQFASHERRSFQHHRQWCVDSTAKGDPEEVLVVAKSRKMFVGYDDPLIGNFRWMAGNPSSPTSRDAEGLESVNRQWSHREKDQSSRPQERPRTNVSHVNLDLLGNPPKNKALHRQETPNIEGVGSQCTRYYKSLWKALVEILVKCRQRPLQDLVQVPEKLLTRSWWNPLGVLTSSRRGPGDLRRSDWNPPQEVLAWSSCRSSALVLVLKFFWDARGKFFYEDLVSSCSIAP